jgi:hypothetical protein
MRVKNDMWKFAHAHFFKNFFPREAASASGSARRAQRTGDFLRAVPQFFSIARKAVFSRVIFIFLNFARRALRAPRCGVTPRAARGSAGAAPRDTAFFPSKTQKFACRIQGNAYHDRMKRVNSEAVVKSTGD